MIKIEIRDQNAQTLKKLQLNNVLPGKGVTIGRSPECGIVLRDHSVSRQHAQLKSDEGQLFIVDLGSSGGTFVNGNFLAPNQRTHLSSGDVCRCGSLDLVISLLDSEQHEDGGEANQVEQGGEGGVEGCMLNGLGFRLTGEGGLPEHTEEHQGHST